MPPDSSPPLLVLLGFMGAGKSTQGRLLASRLHCPFADLDETIACAHAPIPELFQQHGESGFRQIEHAQLANELQTLPRPSVLSLGGGAFLQPENRLLIERSQATTIFLDAPFELLRERVYGTGHLRPLAGDEERLRQLYEQRRPVYLQAHYTFTTSVGHPSLLLTELVHLALRLGAGAEPRDTL